MLKYYVFFEPRTYPEENVRLVSDFKKPGNSNFSYNFLEDKINEYLTSISLDITLILLDLEKKEEELYRQPSEFCWIVGSDFNKLESNNVIVLDNYKMGDILLNTEIIIDYYKTQLENIYNFLKENYKINEYFDKKYQYEKLKLKLEEKTNPKINKI